MPRLFACSAARVVERTGVGEGVQTPFGTVTFTATANGLQVVAVQPDRWRVSDGAWLEHWETSGMELERLTCEFQPELPEGRRIDGCWGVIWRFLAHQDIARFTAAARLAAPEPRGSGNTGWHLTAVAFESDTGQMHIGTEDADALAERAGDGTLPARWWRDPLGGYDGPMYATLEEAMEAAEPYVWTAPRWYESHGPIAWWREFMAILNDVVNDIRPLPYPENTFVTDIEEDGVSVSLPPLMPGDRGELQFVVAWVAQPDEDDVSTWYAVEQDPREILRQAGCT